MPGPNWAPTLEYVAIPLGSSSAAPVTNPGPKIFNVFHNHPAAFGEVGTGAEVSDSPITVAGTRSIPASPSLDWLPSGDNFTFPFFASKKRAGLRLFELSRFHFPVSTLWEVHVKATYPKT
jgi:hypothetical protein